MKYVTVGKKRPSGVKSAIIVAKFRDRNIAGILDFGFGFLACFHYEKALLKKCSGMLAQISERNSALL